MNCQRDRRMKNTIVFPSSSKYSEINIVLLLKTYLVAFQLAFNAPTALKFKYEV